MNAVVVAGGSELEAKATLPTASVAEANHVLAKATGLAIATDEDYVIAADFALECKRAGENENNNRVNLKQKFLDGCRDIDNYFRGPIAIYAQAFDKVKEHMMAYDERKRLAAQAEQRRKDEERRAAEAESRRLQEETAARIRAEEEARREAQRKADAEQRARTEAAEAQARQERELREAAEAKARGDQEEADKANRRAAAAEEDARKAREQAKTDREAAIEAKRKQLKAERETAEAVKTMDAGAAAATQATTAALSVDTGLTKVGGVARKTVWKWRLREGKLMADVPRKWLMIDAVAVQALVDKLKDKGLAEELLGECFEVYSEAELAVGKKRGG